jgi:transposase
MRHIKGLTKETLKMLARIYQQSKHDQVRQRAHCIQLSYQGYTIAELMKVFKVSRNTIYNWFNAWESLPLVGLYNQSGRGRKKTFSEIEEQQIKNWVKETPKDLDKVLGKIAKKWGKIVSPKTITRIRKAGKMGWYRIRRKVGGEAIPCFYKKKVEELEELKKREKKGEIEIRYVDESGFCLIPYIPYAWQEVNQKIEIKSQRSQRLNVLGFMSRDNQLDAYTFSCSINSDVVIACIDDFCEKITKKTFLIMDNSSVHQNNFLWDKENEWKEKGLEIFFFPNYSPHLNIIEILWRFIKYKWLESEDYESYSTLVEAVEKILNNFGTEYTINFV